MIDDNGPRPVFRSTNPYAGDVEAEDARPHVQSGWDPWTLPDGVRVRRRPRVSLATLTGILLFCGVASVAAGAGISHLTSRSGPPPAGLLGPQAAAGRASSPSGTASGGSTATPLPSPTGPPLTTAQIAAAVDPAIVDITASLADHGVVAVGTGMVLTSSGEALTNNHVVQGASRIRVLIGGSGAAHTAHIVATDPAADVAVIQIAGVSGLATITAGDSSTVAVGDRVVALGNALGRQGAPSVAPGRVTALEQTVTASDQGGRNAETLTGLIQMNARIQPGDSGGPLVNDRGQVIGMDTAAARRRSSGAIEGYAIPINTVLSLAHQLEQGAGVSASSPTPAQQRALLGVQVQDGGGFGAEVIGVEEDGPAAAAGIRSGDTIVGFDGESIDSATALGSALRAHEPGDRVRVEWVDPAGRQHSGTITLAAA